MSELLNNQEQRIKKLCEFASLLIDGHNGRELVETYCQYTESVTAEETMKVIDYLLQTGYSTEKVKTNVGKIINVFHESLRSGKWEKPCQGHFLHYLMLENRQVEKIMGRIRSVTKEIFGGVSENEEILYQKMLSFVRELKEFDLHYIKKENILFPYIERTFPQYRCLKIMWSFHDDFRKSIKNLESALSTTPQKQQINKELGKLFFVVFPIIFREEYIVFPVAYKYLEPGVWDEMLKQSLETGWCYNVNPRTEVNSISVKLPDDIVDLGSGNMDPEQISLMLNRLPVDITFVDENDEVRYFSGTEHRIFPRSRAIIGRKVQNCHPPESVHTVNEILESFRSGTKETADFWIQMKNRFVYIRYLALRDSNNLYKGTIEVSQDVTEIRLLKGEKRLLDWNK